MSTDPLPPRPYHHGDLRPVLVAAAVEAIAEDGPAGLSVRAVARRAGVTHAAATYHFGGKAGLLTAVAAEGFRLLADDLGAAWRATGSPLEVGVAYVRFALGRRPYFAVMYQPDLLVVDDPDLVAAKSATASLLYGGRTPAPSAWPPGPRRGRSSTAWPRCG